MNFEPCFKEYKLAFVNPKSIKLGQMTNLNTIFHVVVSVYQSVNIWNLPQFLHNFGMAYYVTSQIKPFDRFPVIRSSHHVLFARLKANDSNNMPTEVSRCSCVVAGEQYWNLLWLLPWKGIRNFRPTATRKSHWSQRNSLS